jgi:RNA polymerase sigma factor (sigma-70 family)
MASVDRVSTVATQYAAATFVADDTVLVGDVVSRKPNASWRFIERHDSFFRAVIVKANSSARPMLDDLTHEVYVHLWHDDFRVLRQWGRKSPLRAYLRTVIRHLVGERLGRFRPAGELLQDEQGLQQPDSGLRTPEEELAIKDIARLLRVAIDDLAANQRRVINLRYFDDLSYREIGGELRLTPNHVGVCLNRAQARLKQILQDVIERDSLELYGIAPPPFSRYL